MPNTFIGMGNNPDGLDMPMGLGMKLTMHPKAHETFGKMNTAEKRDTIQYVQSGLTGEDAKRRIENVIRRMEQGETSIS